MFRWIHNIYFRVLFIFCVGSFFLIGINVLGFHFLFKKQDSKGIKKHLSNYSKLINTQLYPDQKFSPDIATQLSQELELHIWIEGKNKWRSSKQELPKNLFPSPATKNIMWAHHSRNLYLKFENQYGNLILSPKQTHKGPPILHQIWFFASLLLVLFFCYALIRKLFSPLQTFEKATKEWSKGNFEFQIQNKLPANQWKELGKNLNQMAFSLQQQISNKRNLLLALSHELRTPLTRMVLGLEMMDHNSQKKQLQIDQQEMQTIVSGILEAEKQAHFQKDRSILNAKDFIQQKIQTQYPRASYNISDKVMINASSFSLELLLGNLIKNAFKVSEDVSIIIESTELSWNIQISDQGSGIPSEHIPYITQAFYRVDSSRNRETGGLGLGLYLCQQICDAHNWELRFHSELGKGTCIQISPKS